MAEFARAVRRAGLAHVPVAIELFYPFEMFDEDVLADVRGTVRHCREALAEAAKIGSG